MLFSMNRRILIIASHRIILSPFFHHPNLNRNCCCSDCTSIDSALVYHYHLRQNALLLPSRKTIYPPCPYNLLLFSHCGHYLHEVRFQVTMPPRHGQLVVSLKSSSGRYWEFLSRYWLSCYYHYFDDQISHWYV